MGGCRGLLGAWGGSALPGRLGSQGDGVSWPRQGGRPDAGQAAAVVGGDARRLLS